MSFIDRRRFLQTSAALGSAALFSPFAFGQTASGRRLVLVQLSGGNDGLSTVVPYGDDEYYAARNVTAIGKRAVLPLDDYRGLHPNLKRLHAAFEAGQMAIIEGVGYPDAVRSHFKSLEIWHTANLGGRNAADGWAGRLAQTAFGDEPATDRVVHIGKYAPYSLFAQGASPTVLESPTGYRWFGQIAETETLGHAAEGEGMAETGKGRDAALSRLRDILSDAQASSGRVRSAAARYRPAVQYPRETFGAQLFDLAALIHGSPQTRVCSAALSGFDTHADQRATHDRLMTRLDDCLGAFLEDLGHSEVGRDTLIVVFSEFGRRVRENGSRGTDHGQAGPMFVLGHRIKPGLFGEHPSLEKLAGGDLKFTTDFRRVYATVSERWFGVDTKSVLGDTYRPLDFLPS